MAKVVFFNIPARGHTNPTLAYVEELVRRGERVVYYSIEPFREGIEQTRAVFRSYGPAIDRDPDYAPTNFLHLAKWVMKDSEAILAHVLDEVREEAPDYIIHDGLSYWGKAIAQVLGVPAICSITTFGFSPFSLLTCPKFSLDLARMIPPGLPSLLECRRLARQLQATYQIPRATLFGILNNFEELNIVFTAKAFQPGRNAFGENFRFVGPSIRAESDSTGFPFELAPDRPLVYVSLGTVTNGRPDFFRSCLAAFANLEADVIISVGNKIDIEALGPPPGNCNLARYVPQIEVLRRASVFVTHGGMNSVNEGLYHHVPLVVVPQMAEQALVGRCVQQAGAGICLNSAGVAPDVLRSAVSQVLREPRFAQCAQALGERLKEAGGYCEAANATFEFKQQHGILN